MKMGRDDVGDLDGEDTVDLEGVAEAVEDTETRGVGVGEGDGVDDLEGVGLGVEVADFCCRKI